MDQDLTRNASRRFKVRVVEQDPPRERRRPSAGMLSSEKARSSNLDAACVGVGVGVGAQPCPIPTVTSVPRFRLQPKQPLADHNAILPIFLYENATKLSMQMTRRQNTHLRGPNSFVIVLQPDSMGIKHLSSCHSRHADEACLRPFRSIVNAYIVRSSRLNPHL